MVTFLPTLENCDFDTRLIPEYRHPTSIEIQRGNSLNGPYKNLYKMTTVGPLTT